MALGISGKDVNVALSLDGAPQQIFDDVVGFEASPIYEEASSRKLGKDFVDVDAEVVGWQGSLEIQVSSSVADDLIDAIVLAGQARLPYALSIGEQIHYRDLSSASYTYPTCKITGSPRRVRAGAEKATITFNWKCGANRIKG
jgi:hypothetical protein